MLIWPFVFHDGEAQLDKHIDTYFGLQHVQSQGNDNVSTFLPHLPLRVMNRVSPAISRGLVLHIL
jgi:hypothetical protein